MWKRLQRHFFTGLLALSPLAITLWILVKFYEQIDNTMRPWLQRIPHLTDMYPDFFLTIIAFFCFLGLIVAVGMLARNVAGRAFFSAVEQAMNRIPVVKSVFAAIKQIAEVFLSDRRSAFQEVVLFEYPRPGIYSLGFVTRDDPGTELLNVFLPTTPNPTSGYLLMIPRHQAAILSLTVEEGIRLIISGGSVMSPTQAQLVGREAGELLGAPRASKEVP